jgi:4-hydroxybenzoate polyprenyltransferase
LRRYWKLLTYSSLYITVSAVVQVGIAMVLLGVPLNPAPLVVGLVTVSVYTNDRLADSETDAFSDPGKAAFIEEHAHILRPLADAAYGLAVMVAVTGGPYAFSLTLLPGAFWVFYASDWFDSLGASLSRLKKVLVLNTTIVALAWAVVLTFLPLAFTTGRLTGGAALVFAYFFLRVFNVVEMSNILDVDGDSRIGVDTIPVVFGLSGTRRALYLVNALAVGVATATLATGYVPVQVGLPVVAGTGYSLAVTACLGRWASASALTQVAEAENFLTYFALLAIPFVT